MHIIDHADDRSAAFAASIRQALLQAEYPAADPVIVEAAAVRLASSHSIEAAIGDRSNPPASMIQRDAIALLFQYRAALAEAGRPDLIAARFLRWASEQDASAAYHERTRADFADRVARQTGRPGLEDMLAANAASADASERCRDAAMVKAVGYRARAAELAQQKAA